jgi:hypothetical protein
MIDKDELIKNIQERIKYIIKIQSDDKYSLDTVFNQEILGRKIAYCDMLSHIQNLESIKILTPTIGYGNYYTWPKACIPIRKNKFMELFKRFF